MCMFGDLLTAISWKMQYNIEHVRCGHYFIKLSAFKFTHCTIYTFIHNSEHVLGRLCFVKDLESNML